MSDAAQAGKGPWSSEKTVDVLVYSDDSSTRQTIINSVGRRAGKWLPLLKWTETATRAAVFEKVAEKDFALLVLDGEATPAGGMGISRDLKTTREDCPPIVVTVARPQDRWLGTWCESDAIVSEPLDPVELQETIASILTARGAGAEK